MGKELGHRDRPVGGRFHTFVYKLLAGLAVWFVLASWIFAGHGQTDFLLAVVSGIVLVMAGIPGALGLIRYRNRRRQNRAEREDEFGDWAARDVEISTGPVKGGIAAIETIVPIAAVALGMTLFGLVLHFTGR
jgi:hypothetical protein